MNDQSKPNRAAIEGVGEAVVRDTNMFSRLANEPPAVIPEGYSAPLDIRTAAEIEHDRRALKSAPPKPASDAMRETLIFALAELAEDRPSAGTVKAFEKWADRLLARFDVRPLASAPVPPADGAFTTEQLDKLQFGRRLHHRPFPLGTGAAEPANAQTVEYARRLNDIATSCQIDGREGDANDLWRIAKQNVATPTVRGEREIDRLRASLKTACPIKDQCSCADGNWQWYGQDCANRMAQATRNAILSLPVQPGAGEREAIVTEDDGTRDPLPKGWKPPVFDQPPAPSLTMRSALEQIKIVCLDNAATTVRHDLALEFVGGIATRALSRQDSHSNNED